jgi:predicted Fe-Mo cluster-binding NifX family protein
MKIGITSQNFRTISGHAGKTRRFIIIGQDESGKPVELDRLDLPKEMTMHEYRGDDHPIFAVDVLISGGSGQGFIQRMASQGVQVLNTSETDPYAAASRVLKGEPLPAAAPHNHNHGHQHEIVMPTL